MRTLPLQVHTTACYLAHYDAFITCWPDMWGADFGAAGGGPVQVQGIIQPPPLWHAMAMVAPRQLGGMLLHVTVPASVEARFRAWVEGQGKALLPGSSLLVTS
jgi:hypothetical protein